MSAKSERNAKRKIIFLSVVVKLKNANQKAILRNTNILIIQYKKLHFTYLFFLKKIYNFFYEAKNAKKIRPKKVILGNNANLKSLLYF